MIAGSKNKVAILLAGAKQGLKPKTNLGLLRHD